MPRPRCCRRVAEEPLVHTFKPAGIPMRCLDVLALGLDELEAIRLADLDGLYQDAAAERMGVSRTTFSRVVASARRKVAEALVGGKALHIAGGTVNVEVGACKNDTTGGECPACDSDESGVALHALGDGGCRRRRERGRRRETNEGNQK